MVKPRATGLFAHALALAGFFVLPFSKCLGVKYSFSIFFWSTRFEFQPDVVLRVPLGLRKIKDIVSRKDTPASSHEMFNVTLYDQAVIYHCTLIAVAQVVKCMGGPRFECRRGQRVSSMRIFVEFISPCRHIPGSCVRSDKERVLRRPVQIVTR